MPDTPPQMSLFPEDQPSPADKWEEDAAKRALDELFQHTQQYRTGEAYHSLLQFIAHFRFYSPFNAMLVHVQMPGATFVAPAHRWRQDYLRQVRASARPLVILQPMGPVMFVFDVSDTEPLDGAPKLPDSVTNPFQVTGARIGGELEQTIQNAVRDGVDVQRRHAGSQSAGQILTATPGRYLKFQTAIRPVPKFARIPVRYELLLNDRHSREAQYATLVHELAHLYCGHLGTPNERWWPDRRGLPLDVCEFEAESVCYLVCQRLGIDSDSASYLAGYRKQNEELPALSLDCVLKSAGLIEQMGRETLKPR